MNAIPDTSTLLADMAQALRVLLAQGHRTDAAMIGIHSGGAWVAKRLHQLLNLQQPLGTLNISFYRDDFTRIGVHPQIKPSHLPFNVDERHIILVDDVLHTGRTIRAALNEIFDYGRPASVTLAVLVERPGRELPIEARVAGCRMALAHNEYVKLSGPEDLRLTVQRKA